MPHVLGGCLRPYMYNIHVAYSSCIFTVVTPAIIINIIDDNNVFLDIKKQGDSVNDTEF